MAKKAPGRPKVKAANETLRDQNSGKGDQGKEIDQNDKEDLAGKEEVSEFSDASSEVLGEKDVEIEKLKNELEKLKSKEPKVIEVSIKSDTQAKKPIRTVRQNNLHDVYVKGALRQMTKQSYEAVAKDPKLEVSLPKTSILVEPKIQPCVDC